MDALTTRDRAQPRVITGKQPNKNTGTGRHGMELRGDDLYPTPAPVTKALLRHRALPKNIWECAAGLGHMAAVLAAAGHDVYCSDLVDYGPPVEGSPEIVTPLDFLRADVETLKPHLMPQVIVTNPPFAISGDFVRKGLEFCEEVVILNRLAFLEGRVRRDIIDKHLQHVFVFENRCQMMHRYSKNESGVYVEWTGKKADSAIAFGWFVFTRNKAGPTTLSRIRWEKDNGP